MMQWVVRSILHGGPVELFLIAASAPRHGMCYTVWNGAHKSSPCSGGSRFPLSLSEWYFTICPMPYHCK